MAVTLKGDLMGLVGLNYLRKFILMQIAKSTSIVGVGEFYLPDTCL